MPPPDDMESRTDLSKVSAFGSFRLTDTDLLIWVSKSTRKIFTVPELPPMLCLRVLNTDVSESFAALTEASLILPELSTMNAML